MSTETIKQALEERDSAIEAKFDELAAENEDLKRKNAEVNDRITHLEQYDGDALDLHGAPPRPSIMKVVGHLMNPRDCKLEGPEAEWHQELSAKALGGFDNSVFIPLITKTLDKESSSPLSGAHNLIPTQTMDLIDILRQKSVVLQQGVYSFPAEGTVSFPRKDATSTAYSFSGDGGDSITESEFNAEAITFDPVFIGGLTSVSYKMRTQTGGNIDRVIENDLMETIGVKLDDLALNGSGSSNEPTGVLQQSGIGSLTWGGADSPKTYSPTRFWFNDALDMQEYLVNAKAYMGNLSFLMDAATYKSVQYRSDNDDRDWFGLGSDGRLLGLNVTPTTHMPANTALLGNWSEFMTALYGGGGIAIAVDDGGTNFAKGTRRIRAILPCGFGVRHAASFVKNVKS